MEQSTPTSVEPSPSRRLFTWRTARLLLIGLAILVTLIAIFYTEENWRGQRAWAQYRRELEAKGQVFDWATRIPPPVPDEQNIYKAPRMTEWFVGRGTNDLGRRLANQVTSSIGTTNAIQTAADARDYLAWSDQFAPDFDLIRTALKRPYARIDCDYGQPTTVVAPNFVAVRSVVQTLAQRAHCFFVLGEPDKALVELTQINDFRRILEAAPTRKPITLVAAMMNVAVVGLYADMIAEGLRLHAWHEPQLIALEQQLSQIHLAPDIAETFVDEPMFILRTLEASSRAELAKLLSGDPGISSILKLLLKYAPRGWFYHYMIFHAQMNRDFASGFDAANEIMSPRKIDKAWRTMQSNIEHVTPYNFMASWWTPNWAKALQRYGFNQTAANEAAVACALERYHLARGEYPESLNALTPQFIEKLPHDLIGDQPLHYRRTGDGSFVLYSIGWNEKDDGGTPAFNAGRSADIEKGDWVWQQLTK